MGPPNAVEFAHQHVELFARLARKAARAIRYRMSRRMSCGRSCRVARNMVVKRPAHGLIMPVAVRSEVVLSVSHGCRHFQLAEARSNPLVQRAICSKIASNEHLHNTIARGIPYRPQSFRSHNARISTSRRSPPRSRRPLLSPRRWRGRPTANIRAIDPEVFQHRFQFLECSMVAREERSDRLVVVV